MKKQGVFLSEMATGAEDATFSIIGVIGWEVAFTELKKMFASLPESIKRVTFDIYSPGGDVWDGNGIVQAIGELGKTRETVAKVQVAASMATLIAVACQKRSIASNGRFLIHNAWTTTQGDAADHEKRAKELRDCEAEAAAFYAARTGQTAEAILALMNEERWLTPDETKALGFVTEIDNPFNVDEVAGVKAEIVAAGQWPQALVDIPKAVMVGKCTDCGAIQKETNPPCAACGSQNVVEVEQEQENEDATADGGKTDEATSAGTSTQSGISIESAELAGFARGVIEGRSESDTRYAAQIREQADQIVGLKTRVNDLDALQRKTQGERDSARANNEKLTASLKDATAQIGKLLSGGMSFAPSVETWADALKSCKGDYEQARRKYPELYKEQREQDKSNRK